MSKLNKIFFIFLSIFLLNSCAQSTAFLGPAVTLGTSGNIFQAGMQYGTNEALKKETGKGAIAHASEIYEEKKHKKNNKELIRLVKKHIKKNRQFLKSIK